MRPTIKVEYRTPLRYGSKSQGFQDRELLEDGTPKLKEGEQYIAKPHPTVYAPSDDYD